MNKKERKILSNEEARKLVSQLIFDVLTEKLIVREALKFPPGVEDPSVLSAWHALAHYESDEELRKNSEYAEEQNDYLEMIAHILKKGDPLPQNIIDSYKKYYENPVIPKYDTFWGKLKKLNQVYNIDNYC